LNDFTYILECLAAIIATVFFHKYKHLPIKLIALILWGTVIAETCARFPSLRIGGTNHFIYNCYLVTAYPLLYLIIYRHIKNPIRKKYVGAISILVVSIMLFRAFTTPFLTEFMVFMFSLSIVGLVIILLYYAVDLLKNNTRIILKHKLELFIFSGFMLFGISYIPLSFILTSEDFLQLSREAINVLSNLQNSTVILMNVIFIFGFIWTKPRGNNSN
jgi:hypothetical protein